MASGGVFSRTKRRTYNVLWSTSDSGIVTRAVSRAIMALIVLNVIAVVFETVDAFSVRFSSLFRIFECFSVAVFSVEYLLRILTCTFDKRYSKPLAGRLKFAVSFFALVDLVAILPFYLPAFMPIDLRFVRALRLLRIFRIMKLGKYSSAFRVLSRVLKDSRDELGVTCFIVSILLIMGSSLMYYFERAAQPEVFSSIPAAMWWAVITLTTIGYGDVCPVTVPGKDGWRRNRPIGYRGRGSANRHHQFGADE